VLLQHDITYNKAGVSILPRKGLSINQLKEKNSWKTFFCQDLGSTQS
jgi:hypothetical protein